MSNLLIPKSASDDKDEPLLIVPKPGKYFDVLISKLESVDAARAGKTKDEAFRVVRKLANPKSPKRVSRSQLVLGEVQSGKTSNMTHSIALALDNGIPLVIVITGTKKILDSQTVRDLKRNLTFSDGGPANSFMNFIEFKGQGSNLTGVTSAKQWFESNGEVGRPLCIFVLKNHKVLEEFVSAIEETGQVIQDLSALIIDDEADQAGPDGSKPRRDRSGVLVNPGPTVVNRRITSLRECFSGHNYLLYTATPQALLLSHLGNALSPDCVTVLTAGNGYVGVGDLFPEGASPYPTFAVPLSASDIQAFDSLRECPQSLVEAAAEFLIRGAIARREPFGLEFVTMMVHPSMTRAPMERTAQWLRFQFSEWNDLFSEYLSGGSFGGADPNFRRVWGEYFSPALSSFREELNSKGISIYLADREIQEGIEFLLNTSEIKVINSDTENMEDDTWWHQNCWVLVGGEKLGRGFRVENLLVTYMPREAKNGASALDTVQQRGRFFGYRAKYRPLLKAWIAPSIISTFQDYEKHELDFRDLLAEVEQEQVPLKSWKRVLRSPGLRRPLTRKNVIKLLVSDKSYSPGATAFSMSHLYQEGLSTRTHSLYEGLLGSLSELVPAATLGQGGLLQRAQTASVPFSQLESLLLDLYEALDGPDSFQLSDVLDHLSQYHGDSNETAPDCQVIFHNFEPDQKVQRVDKRGPATGKLDEEDPSRTVISGYFSSQGASQVARYSNNLEREKFILHVMLFDVYRIAVKDSSPGAEDLFSSKQVAFRLQIPEMKFATSTTQIQ